MNQSDPEQKAQCWRNSVTCLQIILQSHSNKHSPALAQKQTYRPTQLKKKKDLKISPHCFSYLLFGTDDQKHMLEKYPLQQTMLPRVEELSWALISHSVQKKIKWIKDL